jgi:tetratricopeptide (TPR) repeat protein
LVPTKVNAAMAATAINAAISAYSIAVTPRLARQADALYREGDERGDNAALKQSIETWHLVLQQRPRDRVPLDWAMTQMNLGNALERLGERGSGTEHLTEAVAAYRAAREERTRDRVPLDWAMTQNNLGTALESLGWRESGTEHLTEAVAAYRAALEERTRDPLTSFGTCSSLGRTQRFIAGTYRHQLASKASRCWEAGGRSASAFARVAA